VGTLERGRLTTSYYYFTKEESTASEGSWPKDFTEGRKRTLLTDEGKRKEKKVLAPRKRGFVKLKGHIITTRRICRKRSKKEKG